MSAHALFGRVARVIDEIHEATHFREARTDLADNPAACRFRPALPVNPIRVRVLEARRDDLFAQIAKDLIK